MDVKSDCSAYSAENLDVTSDFFAPYAGPLLEVRVPDLGPSKGKNHFRISHHEMKIGMKNTVFQCTCKAVWKTYCHILASWWDMYKTLHVTASSGRSGSQTNLIVRKQNKFNAFYKIKQKQSLPEKHDCYWVAYDHALVIKQSPANLSWVYVVQSLKSFSMRWGRPSATSINHGR